MVASCGSLSIGFSAKKKSCRLADTPTSHFWKLEKRGMRLRSFLLGTIKNRHGARKGIVNGKDHVNFVHGSRTLEAENIK